MRSIFRIAVVLFAIALRVHACAQDLSTQSAIDTISLPFTALTINDGLSQGMVNCIAQDRHGFLWFGTKDGLNRYDGYTFTVFRHDPEDSTTIRESTITSLNIDGHGRLWVGTANGLDLFDPTTEHLIHLDLKHPNGELGSVVHLVVDDNGDLWFSTTTSLAKVTFSVPPGVATRPSFTVKWYSSGYATVSHTRDGTLWGNMNAMAYRATPRHDGTDVIDTIGVMDRGDPYAHFGALATVEDTLRKKLYGVFNNGIVQLDPRTGAHEYLYTQGADNYWLQCMSPVVDRNGVIWIPTYKGLFRFDPATRRLSNVRTTDPDMRTAIGTVKWTTIDRSGTLWVGTSGYGLLKYDPRIERFHTWHDASIRALYPGAGEELIVTRYDNFLNVFDTEARKYITELRDLTDLRPDMRGAIPFNQSEMVVQDPDGVYWCSMTYGHMVRYDPTAKSTEIITPKLATGRADAGFMFPLLCGRNNALWCGGDSALWRVDRRSKALTKFQWPIPSTNNPYAFVAALHEGADGIIWAGTMKGLLRFDPSTDAWKHYANDPADANTLAVEMIFSIAADPQDPTGVLWLGTNGGGLNRFDAHTGKVTRYNTTNGLPNDVVYGVLPDDAGKLWMSTNKGLARFDPQANTFRNFSVGDGLQSDEFNRHAYCKDARGRLYFGGVSGFNWFDPQEIAEDSTPVVVRVTGIRLMNKPVTFGTDDSPLGKPVFLSEGMEIPYSANMVTFTFAAMEFSAPELHEYRYMLEGFDPDWIEAGHDNSAIYTNLDPGNYTFRVRARNRDGIWAEHGTAFTLTVHPPWYRTWWFFALCGFVIIGGTWYYIRSLRRQKEFLEKTVADRTRELSREKDRSEELLNNILPLNVAAELKNKGHAEARHFDQVTVLFSDFKEFTRVSEQLTPSELVEELNVCFNAFDRIMEKYGVEKIKTIGDAYMAAGGVPDPSGGMPVAVVLAGLEMQQIMRERQAERTAAGKPTFAMRVGIHTGPVVAGIVGRRKFAYDIWGDTVNIASRMETTGDPGEVNISDATYALVKDEAELLFTPRGRVSAKGKGELEMHYVRARSIQAIVDAEPVRPEPAEKPAPIPTYNDDYGPDAGRGTVEGSHALTTLRILLAEDNEFNAMVAQGHLENWLPGVRLTHVPNGAKAVEAMRANDFDVVLMDIQMPEMNGYDATRAIRALPGTRSRVPIIAMTANVMKAEIDRCTEAGMNGFVPKPYKKEQLMEAIGKVVNGSVKP